MNADEWAAIAAWTGVVVAVGAAIVAGLQARSAAASLKETKKARAAAQDQAESARESARAASVSASATVDQAGSARESVDLARRTLHRADQPRFELEGDIHEDNRLTVVARMVAGPPEVTASGRWRASSTGTEQDDGSSLFDHREGSTTTYRIVLGDRILVPMDVPDWAVTATIRLDLHCTDVADDERQWDSPTMLEWSSPVGWVM